MTIDHFDVGDAVEIKYTAPTTSRTTCKLGLGSSDRLKFPLGMSISYIEGDIYTTTLNLNPYASDITRIIRSGFDFTLGKNVTIRIVSAQTDGFNVYFNGNYNHGYFHDARYGTGPEDVNSVSIKCNYEENETVGIVLHSIAVLYKAGLN